MTLGPSGAEWRRGRQAWQRVSAFETDVVDAGGAGDWTIAAFLATLGCTGPGDIANADIAYALRRAQAVAALSCQVLGARGLSSMHSLTELDQHVQDLMRPGQPAETGPGLPRKTKRQAACTACLAAHA